LRPGHEHPVVVLIIAAAIGALAGFLVDSASLVVVALLQTDQPTGADTVFGASVTTVESYLRLAAGGVGLLAASTAWRRLRPRGLDELGEEGEPRRVR
jgi:preprotein translocase subunit SecG